MKAANISRYLIALLCTLLVLGCITAAEAATGSWKYKIFTANGTSADYTEDTCYEATLVSKAGNKWTSGSYVLDKDVNFDERIELADDATIQLVLLDGYTLNANRGISIGNNTTLSIYAQSIYDNKICGKLIANEKKQSGVGIGTGSQVESAGKLFIHGGIIKAWGGDHDAGIGSGDGKKCIDITIYEGTVEAHGGNSAAGIGDGRGAESGSITIYDGWVQAYGGHYGAGIGGGNGQGTKPMRGGHHTKPIKIYGGYVEADGGDDAAGIGGGEGGNCGTIEISGSDTLIYAGGGYNGAGIGGGECESTGDGGTIKISEAKVNAWGGHDGAAIGGGDNGHVDKIEIISGKVKAYGGDNGAGIGGGIDESSKEIIIRGGEVWAYANNGAAIGGGKEGHGGKITITGGDIHAYGDGGSNSDHRGGKGRGAGIGGGWHGNGGTITISGGTVYAESFRGAGIGGGDSNINGTCRTGEGAYLTVTGGKVTARAMYYGIGTGMEDSRYYFSTDRITSARSLTVTGGTVDATGYVAGFGGDSGTVKVDGGTVNLHCWSDCPEWNLGHRNGFAGLWLLSKDAGEVIVNGGTLNVWGGDYGGILLGHESQMTVRGGSVNVWTDKGPAIGNDGKGPNVSIYGGNLHLYGCDWDERIIGGEKGKSNGLLIIDNGLKVIGSTSATYSADRSWGHRVSGPERKNELQNAEKCRHAWIFPCDHGDNGKENYTVTDRQHTLNCKWCCKTLPAEDHTFVEGKCSKCGYQTGVSRIISFAAGGGTGEISPVQVLPGTMYPLPMCTFTAPDPEKTVFDAWTVKVGDAEAVDKAEGEPVNVTADTVVTAKWKNLYTVSFDSKGGGDVDPQIVEHGDRAEQPENIRKDGYALSGWKDQNSAENQLYDFNTPVTADITLVAVWTDNYKTIDVYGTNVDCTARIGLPAVLPDKNIVRGQTATVTVDTPEHYVFKGWYDVTVLDAADRVVEYNSDLQLSNKSTYTFQVDDSRHIAAVFEIDPKDGFRATIGESIENGTISISGLEYDEDTNCWCPTVGSTVTLSVNSGDYWPDTIYYTYDYTDWRDGYTEKRGLEIDPENGEYSFVMPAADITLYATFDNQEYSLYTYTTDAACLGPVDCNITVSPLNQKYKVHDSVSVSVEQNEGNRFIGWYPVTGVSEENVNGVPKEKVTVYDADSLLSTDLSYTFSFGKEDRKIAAVFRSEDKLVTVIPVNSAQYMAAVEDAIPTGQYDGSGEIYDHTHVFSVPAGKYLAITALDEDSVLHWKVNGQIHEGNSGKTRFQYVTDDVTVQLVYKEQVGIPVFSPEPGYYKNKQLVTITSETEDATILYSTDTTPQCGYSAPIEVDADTTIRAIATKAGMKDSDVAEAVYTIDSTIKRKILVEPGSAGGVAVQGEQKEFISDREHIRDLKEDEIENGDFYYNDGGLIVFYYPDCDYAAPDGYVFTGWQKWKMDEETGEETAEKHIHQPGTPDYDDYDYTLVAQWANALSITTDSLDDYGSWRDIPAKASAGDQIMPVIRIPVEAWNEGARLQKVIIRNAGDEEKEIAQITKNIFGEDLITTEAYPVEDGSLEIVPQQFTMPDVSIKLSAEFIVLKNITATATGFTGMYDGAEHGITVTVTVPEEGAKVRYSLDGVVFKKAASPVITRADESPLQVWYRITADGYNAVTGFETVTIANPFGEADFSLPDGTITIEDHAFEGAAMSVVKINGSCTKIGAEAFKNCRQLRQIRVPKDCVIGTDAFVGCEMVFVYGPEGSLAKDYCDEENHDNCVFITEAAD